MLADLAHLVIHEYADGELIRQVTLGQEKLGLPDLVVEQVSRQSSGAMSWLINFAPQTDPVRSEAIEIVGQDNQARIAAVDLVEQHAIRDARATVRHHDLLGARAGREHTELER